MEKKVVTFGEIMLRLEPPGYLRLVQADSLNLTYAGAEANVAVALANFGVKSYFVTKLPENPLGQAAANHVRRFGVDTSHIQWGGDRIGVFFTENGASQRAPLVLYDRANSAISGVKPGEIPWQEILNGKDWFHFTGITPALGNGPAETTLEGARIAKEMGLTVSCDLNFRSKLWTPEMAGRAMSKLMEFVDVAIGISAEEAEKIFGIESNGNLTGYGQVAYRLVERFNLKYLAITLRKSYSASDNGWSAILFDGKEAYQSREYKIHVVDRIGTGDSFSGSLIYALLAGYDPQNSVDFAAAASCLNHTIPGDFNHVSMAEVEALVAGDGSGRIQR